MNSPKFSIIIPVYNVERYLDQCMKTVLCQSEKDFEVILIDDGSQDSSSELCDSYADRDRRVKVVHKINGGLMSSWMRGIEEASAEYVVFIDSDDWIAPHMFEKMWCAKQKYNVDIVICNFCKIEGEIEHRNEFLVSKGYYDYNRIKSDIYPILLNAGDFQKRGIDTSRCGKLIRKELILNNLKYCDQKISFSEDLNIIFPVLLDCNSMFLLNSRDCDYFYRMNPNSILHKYNKEMYKQIRLLYPRLFQACIDKRKEEFDNQIIADYLAAMVQCYKNELMSSDKFCSIRTRIGEFCTDEMFIKAYNQVPWKHYRKLNVLIIWSMRHWGFLEQYVITRVLWKLKRYKIKRLEEKLQTSI